MAVGRGQGMSIELAELQESARHLVTDLGVATDETALWSHIVELGWLLTIVPEALGGLDAGPRGACALQQELGRGLSTAPFLPAMLALDAICQSSHMEQAQWIERLIGGEQVTASLAASNVRLVGGKLEGVITGVPSADRAGLLLLWDTDCQWVALVGLAQAGVEIDGRATWDQTRRLFDVRLSGVALSDQMLLAEDSEAQLLVRRLLALRDFGLAADAIGGASALLERTVDHLQTRVQFRRPLALFQALKHRCADMKAAIAAAEALLLDALLQMGDQLTSPAAGHRSMGAKLLACSTFAQVAEDCLQLHGGIGMAEEHPCHLYLKRALLTEHLGESPDVCAAEIGRQILDRYR